MLSEAIGHQLIVAAVLMAATFLVHAIFIAISASVLRGLPVYGRGIVLGVQEVIRLMGLSIWLLIAHLVSIWMWAFCYLHYNIFGDVETALYFAGATYTTLGNGDVLPPVAWRLLSAAMATNGLLLFGLSTAILVDASRRLRLGGGH